MSIWVRAVIAVALLAGLFLLAAFTFSGLTMLTVWYATESGLSGNVLRIAVVPIAVLVVLAGALRATLRWPAPEGLPVDATQAPELWATVREVAARVGTRPPGEIRLIGEANATVIENARLLGLAPGRRCLYLGTPLLVALGISELKAVLSHELGHYARGDTRFQAATYLGYHTIEVASDRMAALSARVPLIWLVRLLFSRILLVVPAGIARRSPPPRVRG